MLTRGSTNDTFSITLLRRWLAERSMFTTSCFSNNIKKKHKTPAPFAETPRHPSISQPRRCLLANSKLTRQQGELCTGDSRGCIGRLPSLLHNCPCWLGRPRHRLAAQCESRQMDESWRTCTTFRKSFPLPQREAHV